MPFDLYPHEVRALVGKYELTGHLMSTGMNLESTREDLTTLGDGGWTKEGVLLKTATYNIEGFYEGVDDEVFKGPWSAGEYAIGNIVIFSSVYYECTVPRDSSDTDDPATDTSSWKEIAGGFEPIEKRLNDMLGESENVSVLNGNDASDPVEMLEILGASHATTPDPTAWTKFQVGFAPQDGGFLPGYNVIPIQTFTGAGTSVHQSTLVDLGKEHTSGGVFHFHLTSCEKDANINVEIRHKTVSTGNFAVSDRLYSANSPLAPTGSFDEPTELRFSATSPVHRYIRCTINSSIRPFRLFLGFAPTS